MHKMRLQQFIMAGSIALAATSCGMVGNKSSKPTAQNPGRISTTTGIEYSTKEGEEGKGYFISAYTHQPDAPNMGFIEGGRAVMGSCEEDLLTYGDNRERTVSVASFYMNETEAPNINSLESLEILKKDSNATDGGQAYQAALPDTLVWRSNLDLN